MKKLYFDMDGVLADFDGQPNALQRFINEVGFFTQLKPLSFCEKLERQLQLDNNNIYILSSSPNPKGDIEKTMWLYEHLPSLKPENIIFVRGGDKKQAYASRDSVLFDDYSQNLIEWEAKGGKGVKCLNGRNGKGIKWKGSKMSVIGI